MKETKKKIMERKLVMKKSMMITRMMRMTKRLKRKMKTMTEMKLTTTILSKIKISSRRMKKKWKEDKMKLFLLTLVL